MSIGQSVVVGVDGSPEARDAVLLGQLLSRASGGRLHFVAAAQEPAVEVAALRARLPMERIREALLASAAEQAAACLDGVVDPEELGAALTLRIGRPEHVLTEVGRELGADLFVLGGRRHTTPTSWIRRGTAHHLLRTSVQPLVLTGPAPGRPERVVAAVDISFATQPTIAVARRLAELLDAPLQVLHVVGAPELPRGFALDLDFGSPSDVVERAERELEKLVPNSQSMVVHHGDVLQSVRRVVREEPSPLLVLGAQGRGWVDRLLLGSTTEAVLAELPSALAVVPCSPGSAPQPKG